MIFPGIGQTFPMPHLLRSVKLATAVWGPLFETDVDQKPYNLGNISRLETATYFLANTGQTQKLTGPI